MLTYVILRLVSMMFMLEGTATSMAVLLVMLASPSEPESDPETTLRWPFGTFNIEESRPAKSNTQTDSHECCINTLKPSGG